MRKLVFGCGYLGMRIALRWRDAGHAVWVVTRHVARASELARAGFLPLVANVTDRHSLTALPAIDTLLFAVGFDRTAEQTVRHVYVNGLSNVLDALPSPVNRFLYISSTGVYGTAGGDWVDEQTACRPSRESAQACYAAEQLLREHSVGHRTLIFRCAGIYGPGRVPYIERLKAGSPLAVPADGFLNLIHVDDAARLVVLAEESVTPPDTINLSDGQPVLRRDYYGEVARLLGVSPPQFVAPAPDQPAARRAMADKRVSNRHLRDLLAPTFQYPSYREGLAAIVPH